MMLTWMNKGSRRVLACTALTLHVPLDLDLQGLGLSWIRATKAAVLVWMIATSSLCNQLFLRSAVTDRTLRR